MADAITQLELAVSKRLDSIVYSPHLFKCTRKDNRRSQVGQRDTYKNPNPKIPTTIIFFCRDICMRYTISIGIQSTIRSSAMLVAASEIKKSCRLLTDPTSVQFHDIGCAWRKVAMKNARIQRPTTPIRISFIRRNPGEIRLSTKMRR